MDTVNAAMREAAERRQREAVGYRARIDAERPAGLRRVYEREAFVAEAEALAYRSGCSCVYAVVIRATPQVLRDISGRPAVRAVDPAPEVWSLDRTVFSPPLPEQTDRAAAQRGRERHGPGASEREPRPGPHRWPTPAPSAPRPTGSVPASPPPSSPSSSPAPAGPEPTDGSAGPDAPATPEDPPATPDGIDDTPHPKPTGAAEPASSV